MDLNPGEGTFAAVVASAINSNRVEQHQAFFAWLARAVNFWADRQGRRATSRRGQLCRNVLNCRGAMRALVQVARRMKLHTWHWNFCPSMRVEARAVVQAEVQEDRERDALRPGLFANGGFGRGRGLRRNRDAYDF